MFIEVSNTSVITGSLIVTTSTAKRNRQPENLLISIFTIHMVREWTAPNVVGLLIENDSLEGWYCHSEIVQMLHASKDSMPVMRWPKDKCSMKPVILISDQRNSCS